MKYILYTHGGSGNHGCEALARTVYQLLTGIMKEDDEIYLATYRPEEDKIYMEDLGFHLIPYCYYSKKNIIRIIYSLINKFGIKRQNWYYRLSNNNLNKMVDSDTVAFSIGGDNYCYGAPYAIYATNKMLRAKGAKTILLGCSIDKEAINEEMIEDLSKYDLICVRESITYRTLREIGLSNIVMYPDTAFTLSCLSNVNDIFMDSGEVIGINVSPLIAKSQRSDGIVKRNYVSLIQWILDNTNSKIALIPHVVWDGNNDIQSLNELSEHFCNNKRIKLYSDANCIELKTIISKCNFLVAARTHASIAGYSLCVPTLVVGYSVKALGIATDIFGSSDDYVIPVQEIYDDNAVLNKFKPLYNNRNSIKSILNNTIPQYSKAVDGLKDCLIKVITK